MPPLAAGLQPGDGEADGTGPHGVRDYGLVCHGDAVAAPTPRSRCTAVGMAEGVLAAVLWRVCAAHVLFAVVLLEFLFARLVLCVGGRGGADAVVRFGFDDGCKHARHVVAAEK